MVFLAQTEYWLTGVVVGILGALGGAIAVATPWILQLLKARHDARREQRADAITEYKEIVDKLQARCEALQSRADSQEVQIYRLHVSNTECEKRVADERLKRVEMEGEVRVLQMQVRRLQARADDLDPPTVMPTLITTDKTGRILSVVGGVAPLLHWLPTELQGKLVDVVIPERLRSQHHEAFAKTVHSGQLPAPDRVILTYALTREGEEVPVKIHPSGWQDQAGNWFFTGEMTRRQSGESGKFPKPSGSEGISGEKVEL